MTTSYKVLGQSLNYLNYSTDANTKTIVSKLKIKNTSYPGRVSVSVIDNDSIVEGQPLPESSYLIKNKEILFDDSIEISGGIVVDPESSLIVSTESGENIIIQAYGTEETI
jgi:hypothetical protein